MGRHPDPNRRRLPADLTAANSDPWGYRQGRHIYFIQATQGGLIKIGSANDPWERLRNVQACCPIPLRLIGMIWEGGRFQEKQLHLQFAELCHHGEWFHPAPDLLAHIAEHATDPYELPEPGDLFLDEGGKP